MFLALATFYGYYHVVRQHYGFVALYNTINRDWDGRRVDQDFFRRNVNIAPK